MKAEPNFAVDYCKAMLGIFATYAKIKVIRPQHHPVIAIMRRSVLPIQSFQSWA